MDTISPQTSSEISEWVSAAALRLEAKVIAWRRDIHQNPEFSYHETRTAALAAKHLSALGYEVTTGVGETGVVGILKGGKPGPVVALRADMDALRRRPSWGCTSPRRRPRASSPCGPAG
jgi:metal-dependent amidase/aminoacylase/carboxypeptidase family protein